MNFTSPHLFLHHSSQVLIALPYINAKAAQTNILLVLTTEGRQRGEDKAQAPTQPDLQLLAAQTLKQSSQSYIGIVSP
ncbi:hypothetical protein NQZ68_008032 [Dissostichus eleginoides]|nr:hypothetical protein NQZ68_008032 [Dissostichus eleginoides]